MNRRLHSILLLAVAVLAGGALISWRAMAAPPPASLRLFLPSIQGGAPAVPLPDLAVAYVYINMRGYRSGCVPTHAPLVIVACVQNLGQGDAGPFGVAIDGVDAVTSAGLASHTQACLETNVPAGYWVPVNVAVDPHNAVEESDEANNTWTGQVPVPTPPATCTPTPTATPSPSPTPTATPTVSCIRAGCS